MHKDNDHRLSQEVNDGSRISTYGSQYRIVSEIMWPLKSDLLILTEQKSGNHDTNLLLGHKTLHTIVLASYPDLLTSEFVGCKCWGEKAWE